MIIQQEVFKQALSFVGRAVGRRAELPILSHVLFSIEEKKLTLTTTNLQLATRQTIPITGGKKGEICVPATTLIEFITSLPSGDVSLEIQDLKLSVKSGSFRASIQGMASSEFPNLSMTPTKPLSIPFKEFSALVDRVSFAASSDESRKELTGILLTLHEKKLQMVATDGYRLSLGTVAVSTGKQRIECIIPARAMIEIARMMGGDGGEVQVSFQENQVICVRGERCLMTQIIEGSFPPYEKIIPSSFSSRVVVEKDVIEKAVRVAAVFTTESTGVVSLMVRPGNKIPLLLSSTTANVGQQHGEVDASVEGHELTIAFNVRYILEAISAIQATQISFELTGPLKPCKIQGVGEKDVFHIVMPVRTQGT